MTNVSVVPVVETESLHHPVTKKRRPNDGRKRMWLRRNFTMERYMIFVVFIVERHKSIVYAKKEKKDCC